MNFGDRFQTDHPDPAAETPVLQMEVGHWSLRAVVGECLEWVFVLHMASKRVFSRYIFRGECKIRSGRRRESKSVAHIC